MDRDTISEFEACSRLRAVGYVVEVHGNQIQARVTHSSMPDCITIDKGRVSALAVKRVQLKRRST